MKTQFQLWVAAGMFVTTFPAMAVQLVTQKEMMQSQNSPPIVEVTAAPSDPLAPQIVVIDPDASGSDKVLKNPFNMEVVFKTQEGASLDFKSFQALYGGLKLDITDRLLKEAVKTPGGLKLANVTVPSGRHRILLRIKDSQSRMAEKEIQFKVD
jgi:hypothetical protein